MLTCTALALALHSFAPAHAPTTVGMHLASAHASAGFENRNTGLYLRRDGWMVGGYHNSNSVQTCYLGYAFGAHDAPFNLMVGAATGYRKGITPALIPSFSMPVGKQSRARLWLVANSANPKGSALHVSLEWVL